jgi:hypothetical protein
VTCDRWVSPGPPVSSTNKTDCHDIAEIFFKVALNAKNKIKSNQIDLQILITPCDLVDLKIN